MLRGFMLSGDIMHILITGEVGIGKSTLIDKLLQKANQPIFGFRTEKTDPKSIGSDQIYIHPATGEKTYSDQNVVGFCSPAGTRAKKGGLDNLGVKLLTDIPVGSIVLMDELGFIESEEPAFCDAVLRILDGPCFVLAAVKAMNTPFLEKVRSHENALVVSINADNRETLCQQILDDLQRLDPKSPLLPE